MVNSEASSMNSAQRERRILSYGLPLRYSLARMVHYFKFRQDLFSPQAAKDVYVKRGAGKGWPEECPPIRAANSFGFDLLANFNITFTQKRDKQWAVAPDVVIQSD